MKEFDELGQEISEAVRSAMESIPKDIGSALHDTMSDLFDETASDQDSETVDRSFEVGPNAELSVSDVSGQIIIRADDTESITVRATKHGSRRRMENTRIETSHEGRRVTLRTRGDQGSRFGLRGNVCAVDYEIVVPRTCDVQAEGVSSDISLRGTRGDINLKTVSGDIGLVDIAGDCSVTTVSGDVQAEGLQGELKLRTTSGDATVRTSHLNRFNLNTVSGDLSIETPLTTGEHYMAKTVSGDLRIGVPAGTGATVQMKSVSGDVSSDLPAEIIKSSRRNWQGRINGGGANVEMNSVSGDLRITLGSGRGANASRPEPTPPQPSNSEDQLRPEPPIPPIPPVPPIPPTAPAAAPGNSGSAEATSAVLHRLAQGEISVEEAMAQLDATER